MRSRLLRALAVCVAIAGFVTHRSDAARANSVSIVISQVYGGGGNSGAAYKNDFIELYNLGSAPVSLNGWSVQYTSASGTSWSSNLTPLSGTLQPGAYYLIQEAAGAGGSVNLPTPNATGSIAMSATAAKVALVNSTIPLGGSGCPFAASVVDFVGYGTTDCSEGSASAPVLTNTTAAFRKNNGAQDTDVNSADFTTGAPNPRNSPQNTGPTATLAASPASGTPGAALTFTAFVTAGTSPTSTGITVKADLTPIDGGPDQAFTQDGVDPTKFTLATTIGPGATSGPKTIVATVADLQGRSNTAQTSVSVTSPTDTAPSISSFSPQSGATNVPVTANVVITFSEPVTATGAFSLTCGGTAQTLTVSVSSTTFTLDPAGDLPYATDCSVHVTAANVHDTDTVDPPDNPAADASWTFTTEPEPAQSNALVVISQIYGGGGNSGATYQNDFVELYNRSTGPVNITGWSLQYSSAAGSSWGNGTGKTTLYGTIGSGEYYLVALASGGATGSVLPPANISGPTNIAAGAGKLALVDNLTTLTGNCPIGNPDIVDFVGYGATADCKEGSATAPTASNTTSDDRKQNGQWDTDDNNRDFVAAAPNPRRTAPIVTVEIGPSVTGTDPASNAAAAPHDPTIEVDFSEPVTLDPGWLTFACPSSGVHASFTEAVNGNSHYVTPNDGFTSLEVCTVTVHKDLVHDVDTDDVLPGTDTLSADYVWSFTIAADEHPPYTPDVHLTMGNPTHAVTDVNQPNNYLMSKPEYSLSYNRDAGRPNWVSWHLTPEWYGSLARVDTFRADPQVPPDWYRVESFDFQLSGFDRGHMTPNADRDGEIPINQATYLMSNMVAQSPDNNQGPWADLENYLRSLADAGNELYIVSGPAGAGGTGSNGGVTTTLAHGHVMVPAWTWKAALVLPRQNGDDVSRVTCSTRTIAALVPNTQGIRNTDWTQFLTTIDSIETLTGFDLFSNVPPTIQNCIQAGVNGVNPQSQVVTLAPIPAHHYGDADFAVDATASSGLPVTLTIVSGPATLAGGLVRVTGVGTVTIRATQNGNVGASGVDLRDAFARAVPVEQTFLVDRGLPVFSALDAPTVEAGVAAISVSGTLSLGALVPTGIVTVALNGAAIAAAIGPDGRFTASFPAQTFTLAGTPYAIGLSYAGDSLFAPATGASSVTVVDTTPPVLSPVTVSPDVLGPPNHSLIDVAVAYSASDFSGAPVCSVGVASNEPANATGDGNTSPDWLVIDAHHVQVRDERAGSGRGRVYTITVTCTDASRNTSSKAATVSVPK